MVDHEDGFFLPPSGGNRISSSCINMMERGGGSWKPNTELSPACPRCGSSNTKFCYYNNYSLTQPRYFCKGCRRYWTKGGSLRNVPIGGGCRKSRRSHHMKRSPPIRVPSTTDNIHGNFVAPSPFGLISTTHRYSPNSPSTPPGSSSSPDACSIVLMMRSFLVVSQEMVWPSISAADLMLPRHQILDIDYSGISKFIFEGRLNKGKLSKTAKCE
ncbi:hypothetical protein Leryth_000983 [Lithospermum erythrorhizon]|nr:hypothetical protein Leryth_000983 [Lithospermum erythrorhizon]